MKNFDFLKHKYKFISLSIGFILIGCFITFVIHKGFARSLDFNGGIRIVLQIEEKYKDSHRKQLESVFGPDTSGIQISLINKDKNFYQLDFSLESAANVVKNIR